MSVGIVMDSQTVVELDSQDIFIRICILGSEEIQVVRFRMSGRIQLVRTIIDNLTGSFGSQIQVIRIIVAFQLQVVILAVRTFVQTELCLQRQCRPAVHTERTARLFLACRKIIDGIVDILYHLGHHQLTRVTRLVQCLVGRTQFHIVPGHIAEAFDFLEIEERTEEAGQCRIFHHRILVAALIHIRQQGIHLAQVGPCPSPARSRHGTVVSAQHLVGKILLHVQVTLVVERALVQQVVVKRVTEKLQVALCLEIVALRYLAFRTQVEQTVTRSQPHCQYQCCKYIFFHTNLFLVVLFNEFSFRK